MRQLLTAGLPTTAELSSYFNNPNITKIFLGFDDDKEKDRLKKFGKDNDASFNFGTLRRDIRGNKNIKNFENIIALNGGENSSVAAEKMDNIVETLTYYTLNDMFVNGSSERVARNKATALIKDSFQIEGSYYVPTILGGKKLNQNQVDAVIDKATVIKDHYLKEWNAVPFGSTKEETINEDIVEQFNINLKEGEWRNTADGDSLIYGIILADGGFAPVQNANGEFLQFKIDSFGDYTLPGTDIQMNMQLKKLIEEEDSSASLAIDDRLRYVDSGMIMSDANNNFQNSMKQSESSGNYRVVNSEGYMGAYQFGNDRLQDFKNATGKSFTNKEFKNNSQLQDEVFNWHTNDIVSEINSKGLDSYIGKEINGVLVTLNGLVAVAHLGGKTGMAKFLKTNGKYNPADKFGTTLTNYLNKFKLTK
jgi:hypothetical protein